MPFFTVQGPRVFPAGGDITTGLTHYWPMDDGHVTGATITDTAGTLDGSSIGGVTSAAGPTGTARAFDGVAGSYISTISDPFDWNSGSFTIASWVYIIDNSVAGSGGGAQTYFNNETISTTKYCRILNASGVGPGVLICSTSTGGLITGNNAIPSGQWKHIAYTNAGGGSGGTMTLYIGGVPFSASTESVDRSSGTSNAGLFATSTTAVGALNGREQKFRIYSRALSAADVAALFAAGG